MESPLTHEQKQAAKRVTWLSVTVNIALSILQIAVGFTSKSAALIADGIHSLSDLVSDGVVLVAQHYGQKGPDADHHYGHHRYETAATLVLGLILLTVGGSMIIYAGQALQSPTPAAPAHPIALVVAGITLVFKELLFRYMKKVAERLKSQLLLANAWHARSDAASSLVVAAALTGSFLGYGALDLLAAAIVGFLIGRMGWNFAWDAMQDLMDRSADENTVIGIRRTLLSVEGVHGLHDLRTRRMGDWVLVDVHLEIDGRISVEEGHDIAKKARIAVMAQYPVLNVMIHVDPWSSVGT